MTARTLVLTALLSAALVSPASAADFNVDTTTDGVSDGECIVDCTLREAVALAGPADNVNVPAGTYVLTDGLLILNGDNVLGTSPRNTTISGDDTSLVFNVLSGVNTIERLTIAEGQNTGGTGGGILVSAGATLMLNESTVAANQARYGGGIANQGGSLTILRSTIRDNFAGTPTFEATGGGLHASGGTTTLSNSTVSGNQVQSGESSALGGGVYVEGGSFVAYSSTIADNEAVSGGFTPGLGVGIATGFPTPSITVSHTIVAGFGPAGFLCWPGAVPGQRNIFTDASCGAPVSTPILGELDNNGGLTDTHAFPATSPALNAGIICEPTDQVGTPRGPLCDIGAFEYDTPTTPGDLDVVTQVVNDNGGTSQPGDFQVHVRRLGVDHAESPAPGLAAPGRDYVLVDALQYTVAGAPATGYTATTGGDCAADGSVVVGDTLRTCTVTYNDNGPQPPSGGGGSPPPPPEEDPPVAGETVRAEPSGTIKVKLPGTNRFVTLAEDGLLPVGTIVDATKGRVTIVAAGNQSAVFYDGIFKIGQGTGAKPLTVLTLVEKLSCPARKASVAAKAKKKRRLWGDGKGRFQVKGKHSAATVVGTKWLVEDTCTTTLTRVVNGRVSVRDFVKKKTVIVKAGKKYVAKAKG